MHAVSKRRTALKKAVLLDTNILLLFVVGSLGDEAIAQFKRTKCLFQPADHDTLLRVIAPIKRRVTTSHILTESSNLLAQYKRADADSCVAIFTRLIEVFDEQMQSAKEICKSPLFARLGLTDAGIAAVSRHGITVLTDDAMLCNCLAQQGIDALNFNHLRQL